MIDGYSLGLAIGEQIAGIVMLAFVLGVLVGLALTWIF